jgi:hypothetical protein
MQGIFSEAQDIILRAALGNDYCITVDDIAEAALFLRKYEYDTNINIQGQNGVGKTMSLMANGIALGDKPEHILDRFIYAYHPYEYAIDLLKNTFNKPIYFDELAAFLPYKLSMSREQVALIAQIENTRSHANTILGASRMLSRVNNNYRDGKVFITILLMERYREPVFTEGAVLIGNPVLEIEDKFFMSRLRPTYSVDDLCTQIEMLPSFAGYIYYDDIKKKIPANVLKNYKKEKDKGIEEGTTQKIASLQRKYKKEAVE